MRLSIIKFLKHHPFILNIFWTVSSYIIYYLSKICKTNNNQILFISYGGRKFDDSPKAIYDEIIKRKEFDNYTLVWAFVNPEKFTIPRGIKIKVDTLTFLKMLLSSKIWISNSGMTRGIDFDKENIIKVETWHGSVLKKGGGEENKNKIGGKQEKKKTIDKRTIRCAQSELDVEILSRIFNSDKSCFLHCGFPRNDLLANSTEKDFIEAKSKLGLPLDKKVILYMPTWREFVLDNKNDVVCKPPINISYWEETLGKDYILLFRAHYAVTAALDLKESEFLKNVSDYPYVNDLYLASDLLISDYSSAIIDYSILEKPVFCFAYDLEEYLYNRGLYWDVKKEMPFGVQDNEKDLLNEIINIKTDSIRNRMHRFRELHASFAKGDSAKIIVDEILSRLKINE